MKKTDTEDTRQRARRHTADGGPGHKPQVVPSAFRSGPPQTRAPPERSPGNWRPVLRGTILAHRAWSLGQQSRGTSEPQPPKKWTLTQKWSLVHDLHGSATSCHGQNSTCHTNSLLSFTSLLFTPAKPILPGNQLRKAINTDAHREGSLLGASFRLARTAAQASTTSPAKPPSQQSHDHAASVTTPRLFEDRRDC